MTRRLAIAAMILLALLPTVPLGAAQGAGPVVSPQIAGPTIDGLFDIGDGRRLYLRCTGSGGPTVILESGMLNDATVWDAVAPGVSGTTRVCAYDRAGLGRSDPPKHPWDRTIQDAVDDLHALLAAAGVEGPYVMVGHSLGGMIARLYAAEYPDEVAGLVLLDATPVGFLPAWHALWPEADWLPDGMTDGDGTESFDLLASDGLLAAVGAPAEPVPAIVITHGTPFTHLDDWPDKAVEAIEAVWYALQVAQAELLDGQLIVAEGAGHTIQRDRPDLVIDAILEVVAAVCDPAA